MEIRDRLYYVITYIYTFEGLFKEILKRDHNINCRLNNCFSLF